MAPARQKRRAAVLLSITGIFVAFLFTMVNLERGSTSISLVEAAAALTFVLNLLYVVRGNHPAAAAVVGISITVVLLLALAHLAGMQAFYWIYTMPLLAFFLLGLKGGLLLNALLLVAYAAFLFIQEARPDIMLSYLLVVVFACLYEADQERYARELERQSGIDPLTGAQNRRNLHGVLCGEIERAQRYGGGLSLILFDVDHYKSVNDRHGHQVGDVVLQELAGIVQHHVRSSDHFFRYGGDEFILLAPETDLVEAGALADKLRSLIERHRFACPRRITISLGLAQWRQAETAEAFLTRADNALYSAKGEGRNCVARSMERASLQATMM